MSISLRLAIPTIFHKLPIPQPIPGYEWFVQRYDQAQQVIPKEECLLLMVLEEGDVNAWCQKYQSVLDSVHTHVALVVIESSSKCAKESPLEERWESLVWGWLESVKQPKRWEFTLRHAAKGILDQQECLDLKEQVAYQQVELDHLNEIGTALSSEKDIGSLLHLIVGKAMELAHSDAASLYLIEKDESIPEDPNDYFANKKFHFEIAKNNSRKVPFRSAVLDISKNSIYGYVAMTGEALLIEDAYFIDPECEYGWGGRDFDALIQYRTKSMLTVPMKNHADKVIGVIQLINCKKNPQEPLGAMDGMLDKITCFTSHHANAIESIASQAAVALENARLIQSIQMLFDGFINASVTAIESRDPTTSGHSGRVAELTVRLGEVINEQGQGHFAQVGFSEAELQEIRYASLLHDFGKIGVREEVLLKAKKLYPHEAQAVMDRFKLLRTVIQYNASQQQLHAYQNLSLKEAEAFYKKNNKQLVQQLGEIDEFLRFIIKCNEPTVLAQEGFERLKEIQSKTFLNHLQMPQSLLTHEEVASLSIPKGSLSTQDREEIESHVTHTYRFLNTIPWTQNLSKVPEIAYAHHERLNGTGYPRKLSADEIPLQSRMMTISDIYDALTAWDRPYKKAIPIERALTILEYEANDHHVDRDLLDLFIEAKVYECVKPPSGDDT